jgi:hypothetical protein
LKSGTNGSHPIILASWEAETGRIEASWANSSWDPIFKNNQSTW